MGKIDDIPDRYFAAAFGLIIGTVLGLGSTGIGVIGALVGYCIGYTYEKKFKNT